MDVHNSKHIVAVCGSQRDGSHTRAALAQTLTAAAATGASTELLDLADMDLPVFDPAQDSVGDAPELRRKIQSADAVVLGSPMYHGSYSSILKTALDYCNREDFDGTTVGLLVVAGGGFPTPALEHLRSVARALGAWVVPHQVAIPNANSAVQDGHLTDDALRERVETLGTNVVEYAGVDEFPATTVDPAAQPAD